jgi:hypothetical protein
MLLRVFVHVPAHLLFVCISSRRLMLPLHSTCMEVCTRKSERTHFWNLEASLNARLRVCFGLVTRINCLIEIGRTELCCDSHRVKVPQNNQ